MPSSTIIDREDIAGESYEKTLYLLQKVPGVVNFITKRIGNVAITSPAIRMIS